MTEYRQQRRIGLALGSGSARGLAHIGIIQALAEMGLHASVVCGTSIGALVGAAYAAGHLETLAAWVRTLNARDVVRYMDLRLAVGGGFADGGRMFDYFRRHMGEPDIQALPVAFAAVATELHSGREIWLREGALWEAVRASVALPGIMTPVQRAGRWLVDGGLVNPVPVSVCRALDADLVIAVNLNGDIRDRHAVGQPACLPPGFGRRQPARSLDRLTEAFRDRASALMPPFLQPVPGAPGLFEVLSTSINLMQDRITRSRMAGDPPDLLIAPRLAHIGLLEFDRAEETIEQGRAAIRRMEPLLQDVIGDAHRPDNEGQR